MFVLFENLLIKNTITMFIGTDVYVLKPGEITKVDISEDVNIILSTERKSKVKVSFLNLWIGAGTTEDVGTRIECNAGLTIPSNISINKITFGENKAHTDEKTYYNSVSVFFDGRIVTNCVKYYIKEKEKIKRKHNLLLFFVFSSFPLLFAGLFEMVRKPSWELGVLLAILFFIAFIPAIRNIAKFNKLCSDESASLYLSKPLNERMSVDVYEGFVNDVIIEKPTKVSGRLFKIIKKIFFD